MKILIAPDSFKGTLSSQEVALTLKQALLESNPELEIETLPLADGGEHSLDCIFSLPAIVRQTCVVHGPYGKPVEAAYAISKKTAILELAQSSGLMLEPDTRDLMQANTYGFGELILDALNHGCQTFILLIGGSATNDGGAGMMAALGARYYRGEQLLEPIPSRLQSCERIDLTLLDPRLKHCRFILAADVNNPLLGEHGASFVFALQKGASPEELLLLEAWMTHWADLAESAAAVLCRDQQGAGAAGGVGFALLCFLHAEKRSGIEIMLELTHFKEKVQTADWVITGEGQTDAQTAFGKTPLGVAKAAKQFQKPVILVSGAILPQAEALREHGIDLFFSTVQHCCSVEEALLQARENLVRCGYNLGIWFKLSETFQACALTFQKYQKQAMTTLNPRLDPKEKLINSVMGLCGESGEVIDHVKKWLAQGHPLNKEALKEELGDVAWYLAEAASALDLSLEEIAQANLNKLKKRYPDEFSEQASQARSHPSKTSL